MPTYDYHCGGCGRFDALRRLALRDEPAPCPACGSASPRVWGDAPALAELPAATRRAMDGNERARHEPRSSGDFQRLRHPAGCGCCSGGRRGATVTTASGAKGFPSKRPWMISH